jgi:hypothetical protein
MSAFHSIIYSTFNLIHLVNTQKFIVQFKSYNQKVMAIYNGCWCARGMNLAQSSWVHYWVAFTGPRISIAILAIKASFINGATDCGGVRVIIWGCMATISCNSHQSFQTIHVVIICYGTYCAFDREMIIACYSTTCITLAPFHSKVYSMCSFDLVFRSDATSDITTSCHSHAPLECRQTFFGSILIYCSKNSIDKISLVM